MRERLRVIGAETVAIVEAGWYTAPDGRRIEIAEQVRQAVAGTVLYGPEPVEIVPPPPEPVAGRIEVTGESSFDAARRLLAAGSGPVAVLNFASALWPGGGFLDGARAQEESLCRASALYACLVGFDDYYRPHLERGDDLYTDRVLHSPGVPVFRDDGWNLLPEPVAVGVLTAAAPNLRSIPRDEPHLLPLVPQVFRDRGRQVLAVAARHGYRRLVLGAWGCGAFRNDPAVVADAFAGLLAPGGPFARHFDEVVFAVLTQYPSESLTARVFARALGVG
ncbi:TIGR02452 family protein [Frankia sp. CNm7]|uniref:TIGR02452 family protein n=1 Tax=Frankia nepalensis TaxID=1836974 RepID=A0A937RD56_9ACTN|nr:TIGR02452 family protein [Frankia nepalensis]MBL7502129.1 TIGR02452 family protein [Frankia nepalensis]MBL7512910.1 TIGR02452 family protein [Frankia nepalensis]MBL7519960.1 TIGR02452 family protein [Frankia nepalensis]MBL7628087.1 TIGR02452 family protein [Frankia nepalensis]